MNRKRVDHLISDWDGTIASFHNWFSPAMMLIVRLLANIFGVTEQEIGTELARNMRKARSHECTFPLIGPYFQNKWHGTNEEFVRKVTEPYFEILDSMRERYLAPFPDALESLEEAARLGVGLSLLSDSTLYATIAKARKLKLQKILCGVYALDIREPAPADVWNPADYEFCRARANRYLAFAGEFKRVVAVPPEMEKPNTGGAEMILRDCGTEPERTGVIGDNRLKDGGVAQALGLRYIWARYGATDFAAPQYREVIEQLLDDKTGTPFTWTPVPDTLPAVLIEAPTYAAALPLLHRYRRHLLAA